MILTENTELDIRYVKDNKQTIWLDVSDHRVILRGKKCIKIERSIYCFRVIHKDRASITFSVDTLFAFPTYNRDIDMEIMSHLDREQLEVICLTEKYLFNICNDNTFWRLVLSRVFNYELPLVSKKKYNYRDIYFDVSETTMSLNDLLYMAAHYGFYDVVVNLLARGADIHAFDDNALLHAAREGHPDVVALLVSKGADIHASNNAALLSAIQAGYTKIVDLLTENGTKIYIEKIPALVWAASLGHEKIVELLLKKAINTTREKNIALIAAAKDGHTKNVDLLLKNGADIHFDNDFAIREAMKGGHSKTVALLLEHGANVDYLAQ